MLIRTGISTLMKSSFLHCYSTENQENTNSFNTSFSMKFRTGKEWEMTTLRLTQEPPSEFDLETALGCAYPWKRLVVVIEILMINALK